RGKARHSLSRSGTGARLHRDASPRLSVLECEAPETRLPAKWNRMIAMPIFRYLIAGLHLMLAFSVLAAGPTKPGRELVEVRGSKLYVQISGNGSPVLFLHGGLHHFDNSFA